jgi:hypothetical protein
MLNFSKLQFLAFLLLLFSLPGCRSTLAERQKVLLSEADTISEQELKIFDKWTRVFSQVFTDENRAQFPSNRDWMISELERIIASIDETARLANEAADKYEEASRLTSKERDKKAIALIAASTRRNAEMMQLFKAQAQLPSDRTIKDQKEFNKKFLDLRELVSRKQREKSEHFEEAKRLLVIE